jgi:hypothetical protein
MMLFNASLAVARVAFCLMQTATAAADHLVLLHRGLAMESMRQLLATEDHTLDVEVMFTMGRLLSIAVSSRLTEDDM